MAAHDYDEIAAAFDKLPDPSNSSRPNGINGANGQDHQVLPLEVYLEEQRRELIGSLDLPDPTSEKGPVTVKDFYAYMPAHSYLFVPTGDLWPASSVNTRCEPPLGPDGQRATMKIPRKSKGGEVKFEEVPIPVSTWLDKNHPVEQMSWVPGDPQIIRDRLLNSGGWMDRKGCASYNLYQPPTVIPGSSESIDSEPWLEHLQQLYGQHASHIIQWLAHRIQKPGEKINHALVLGGSQGIGKDSILEPVKYGVGPWNFTEISPSHLLGRFNGFVKSVILRISEARDLGDVDRYAFYDHTKIYTAAPPDVIRCDEKNLREHAVLNVCGVIITSNHKQDGIYLPADDRRHYVAWSDMTREELDLGYWNTLWSWYRTGGIGNVIAYLRAYDLSGFDPKAPPPKTDAFWEIVNANRAPEDAELEDTIESMKNPAALTLSMLAQMAPVEFSAWLGDRKNRRVIPHRLEAAGYVPVRNPDRETGLWVVGGKRQVVYGRRESSISERIKAAAGLSGERAN